MARGRDEMDRKEGLVHFGERVRDLLADDPRAADEIRRARGAFLEEVERRNAAPSLHRRSLGRRRLWLPLACSASLAAGAAALWVLSRPVTFQIGEARQGHLGDVIEAVDGRIMPIAFSEGSTLVVHHGGRIRVLSLEAGAARVLVEDGVVDAAIAHPKGGKASRKTRWDFEVGPYRVTVNGTKFGMAFHAGTQALRVSTQEGRVTVTGGCLQAARTVSAGETFESSCPPQALEPGGTSAGTAPEAGDAQAAEEAPLAPALDARAPGRAGRVDHWRELLAAGRLQEGLRAAEHANFDRVCRVATGKELLALADAGRFFGPSRRAVTALSTLRQRFPGSADAGTAAFTLGRIVLENEHAYARAADWFETYLREQPRGPLMGDAFGRLMEARLRSGDGAGARASAEQYLRRFPEGPYASEARGVLSR